MDINERTLIKDFEITIFTREMAALGVREQWKKVYLYMKQDILPFNKQEVLKKLEALSDNPTVEQVNEAIGNDIWTTICCPVCSNDVEFLIYFNSSTHISLCKECLEKAYALLPK